MTAPLFAVPVVGLAWHVDALCRRLVADGLEPATRWDAELDGETELERVVRARVAGEWCALCPVAQACLDEHLADASAGGGVRAGYLFPDAVADLDAVDVDRERTVRGPYRQPLECGSYKAARRHRTLGELPLDPACRDAERAYQRDRQRNRRRTKELVDA